MVRCVGPEVSLVALGDTSTYSVGMGLAVTKQAWLFHLRSVWLFRVLDFSFGDNTGL
jgi:hypothetical protein